MENESLPRSILALILIALIPVCFGHLGYRVGKYKRRYSEGYSILKSKINSAFTCFLAGIFFSIIFLHLIPSMRLITLTIGMYSGVDLPCVNGEIIIICVSFFIFCFINDCGFACVSYLHSEDSETDETSEEEENKEKRGRFDDSQSYKKYKYCNINTLFMKYKGNDCWCSGLSTFYEKKIKRRLKFCKQRVDSVTTVVLALEVIVRGICETLSVGLERDIKFFQLLLGTFLIYKSRLLYKQCMHFREEGVTGTELFIYLLTCCTSLTTGTLTGIIVNQTFNKSAEDYFAVLYFKAISAGSLLFLSVCELLGTQKKKEKRRFLVFTATFLGFLLGVVYKFMK